MKSLLVLLFSIFTLHSYSQSSFQYHVEFDSVNIPSFPGLHSYAFAQHNGKWLLIGGREDGLHARQPFAAFPSSNNNTNIYVIDVATKSQWTASVNSLSTGVQEQLQSSNMNFYQDGDTLYLIGGYSYSASAGDHKTFSNLTSIQVSALIDDVVNSNPISGNFKQISDNPFAVTGAQLGKIGNTFYLVGGHRFDGRYNPMGHATYTQTYTNQIRKFTINNKGSQLSVNLLTPITDIVHLHRRDYNLIPQIFPNGDEGYTISSGVFQTNVDLPYLYPVDITSTGYTPNTSFNQYLSNYHSAKACFYDSSDNAMHTLFFGGMSQYYYENGSLIKDDAVPFVKTVSRLTRNADSSLQEFQLPVEMPGLKGASAEFIPNLDLPYHNNEILMLDKIKQDTIIIGHMVGGISSPYLNPFNSNNTGTTSADPTIYRIRLIKDVTIGIQEINGENPFDFVVYPNPFQNDFEVGIELVNKVNVEYYLTTSNGSLLKHKDLGKQSKGKHRIKVELSDDVASQNLFLTLVFDYKFFVSKTLVKD